MRPNREKKGADRGAWGQGNFLFAKPISISRQAAAYPKPPWSAHFSILDHFSIHIFGYPGTVFLPKDFHTATLVDDFIYIIGALGYGWKTILENPIFRLNIHTFQVERLCAIGESPGWIHGHRATLTPSREIVIRGGHVVTVVDGKQVHTDNQRAFILNLAQMQERLTIPDGP